MTCLTEAQMLAILDGGIAPNRAEALSAHAAGCATCRAAVAELETFIDDLRAPSEHDDEAHVQAVMKRLAEPRERVPLGKNRAQARWFARAVAGLSVAALAAGLVFVVRARHEPTTEESSFASRGSKGVASLRRDVGTRIFAGSRSLKALTEHARLGPSTPFTAAYTNLHPSPVYLLVFAVDANASVHWLYPAYTTPKDDPTSISLERTDRERLFPTSVVLDAPAQGDLRIVSVATESPLHVSDIERRALPELTREGLERAFAGASVSELRITITSDSP
jgi:hypothetical protein